MELRAVKGMNDILPGEVAQWQRLEAAFRTHAARHGFAEVRTPLLEHTSLFSHQIGETTDVVAKEMYSFERHGDALTVRPEGTAGAARAYVEHGMAAKEPVSRWYYLGAMFRGERPAKGRYRQFYQAGCEIYGDPGPFADAELIQLVAELLRDLGVGAFRFHVNSLGGAATRARYREALLAYFTPLRDKLGEDSRLRLEKNPLRILDSKDPRDQEVAAGAPPILDLLDTADLAHWNGLRHGLDVLGVDYVVDPRLVRGLDYYTSTLFEVRATESDLGAQSALGGGGRYDNMVEGLGGPKVPAIGFALGLERILSLMEPVPAPRRVAVYLAPLAPAGVDRAFLLARALRALDVHSEVDWRGGKLKSMLRRADAIGARYLVILGDEVERGLASVKDLLAHTQEELPLGEAAQALAARVRQAPGGANGSLPQVPAGSTGAAAGGAAH
jgi:histidyl-tRNA synthetase